MLKLFGSNKKGSEKETATQNSSDSVSEQTETIEKAKYVSHIQMINIMELLILRLNRGNSLNYAIDDVCKLNFDEYIKSNLDRIFSDTPIDEKEFEKVENITGFLIFLEILRQYRKENPYVLCDIIAVFKGNYQYVAYSDLLSEDEKERKFFLADDEGNYHNIGWGAKKILDKLWDLPED